MYFEAVCFLLVDLKHLGFVNNGKPFNDSLFLSLKSAPDIHSVHLKNKKFFFNKACMYGFFLIVILLKLNRLLWILILIELYSY